MLIFVFPANFSDLGLSICPDLSFKAIRRRFKALERQKVYQGAILGFRMNSRYLLERLKEGRPISRGLGSTNEKNLRYARM